MELRHLHYFLAVAEESHFRRAADTLLVSQPTLSLQVQQLEKELGTVLFDRVGRRVRLTQAGEIFREHARRALQVLDEGQIALDELEGLLRGHLMIGTLQTVATYLLPGVLARFATEHPRVRLQVEETSSSEIQLGVAEGRLDLGISFTPDSDDVDTQPLFTEALVLVLPSHHRWTSRKKIAFAALAEEPLVLLSKAFCTRELIDQGFQAAGITPSIAVEMNSISGILATVRAGGPATILPELAVGGGGVKAIALERPALKRKVELLTRRGAYPLRLRSAFTECVQFAMRRN